MHGSISCTDAFFYLNLPSEDCVKLYYLFSVLEMYGKLQDQMKEKRYKSSKLCYKKIYTQTHTHSFLSYAQICFI